MKKSLVLFIGILFILGIVGLAYNKKSIKERSALEEELKEKLAEYSDKIVTDEWLESLAPGLYILQLKAIKENYNYDTSMFKTAKGEDCDYNKTKIELIVNEKITSEEKNYEINYYIVCD